MSTLASTALPHYADAQLRVARLAGCAELNNIQRDALALHRRIEALEADIQRRNDNTVWMLQDCEAYTWLVDEGWTPPANLDPHGTPAYVARSLREKAADLARELAKLCSEAGDAYTALTNPALDDTNARATATEKLASVVLEHKRIQILASAAIDYARLKQAATNALALQHAVGNCATRELPPTVAAAWHDSACYRSSTLKQQDERIAGLETECNRLRRELRYLEKERADAQ